MPEVRRVNHRAQTQLVVFFAAGSAVTKVAAD